MTAKTNTTTRVTWINGEIKTPQRFTRQTAGAFLCRYGIDPPFADEVVASVCLGEEIIAAIDGCVA